MQLGLQVLKLLAFDGDEGAVGASPTLAAVESLGQRELSAFTFEVGRHLVLVGPLPERLHGKGHLGDAEHQDAFRFRPHYLDLGELGFAAVGLDGLLDNGLRIAGSATIRRPKPHHGNQQP